MPLKFSPCARGCGGSGASTCVSINGCGLVVVNGDNNLPNNLSAPIGSMVDFLDADGDVIVSCVASNYLIQGIARTAVGSGYTSVPTVTIDGGGGAGATATATVASGAVSGLHLTNPGSGYISLPTVTITGGGGSGAKGVMSGVAQCCATLPSGATPSKVRVTPPVGSHYQETSPDYNTLGQSIGLSPESGYECRKPFCCPSADDQPPFPTTTAPNVIFLNDGIGTVPMTTIGVNQWSGTFNRPATGIPKEPNGEGGFVICTAPPAAISVPISATVSCLIGGDGMPLWRISLGGPSCRPDCTSTPAWFGEGALSNALLVANLTDVHCSPTFSGSASGTNFLNCWFWYVYGATFNFAFSG